LVIKKAFITGITGQDGYYLSRFLISKGYSVFGFGSRANRNNAAVIYKDFPEIQGVDADLTDYESIFSAINYIKPDEIYNLGGISNISTSYSKPEITAETTGLGFLRILEACRSAGLSKKVWIYQSSSSEMFGEVSTMPQNEKTPFNPKNPYGVAKVFAHNTAINYRKVYGMNISTGISYNHESERRGEEYVTRKISQGAARIKLGVADKILLGNLSASRDWGYAPDYVEAMWKMLQIQSPDDYVLATGKSHTVQDFVDIVFEKLDMAGQSHKYVFQVEKNIRPVELSNLIGDSSKAKEKLGWVAKTQFEVMAEIMAKNDLILEAANNNIELL
jgi:GDPmannose 4,6-dehydratase